MKQIVNIGVLTPDWFSMDKTRDYIRDQEKHHAKRSFDDEFQQMLDKYGFQRFADDEE